jgi:Amt family ammonium transporter
MIEPTILQTDPAVLETALNYTWILVVTFLIFFMHAGFAMLEAGQVRSKNVSNQLTKNLLTWSVGVSVFFVIGAGFASLMGGGGFTPAFDSGPTGWIDWLYGAVFAMTAATIVSGAVAGRAKLRAYVGYTFLLAAIIYPMVIGFTWSVAEGNNGLVFIITEAVLGEGVVFQDFAGGMIVHGMGGIAGLTAAAVLGPRLGRYNEDGSSNVIPGHSMTFAVLGTLMLAFGWYGFNVGTSAVMSEGAFLGDQLGRVAMTTTIAMAAGAMGAGAVAWAKTGKVDTLYVANGLLAGLVGITAIPNTTIWQGAFVVGGLAGAQLPLVFEFVEKRLQIDDVCAVFPVHGSAGVLGTLMYSFVAVDSWNGFTPNVGFMLEGLFAQAVGVFVIAGWTITATAVVWLAFKAVGQARVSREHETEGLDVSEHGVETYPEFGDEGAAVTDGGIAGERVVDPDAELRSDGGRVSDTGPADETNTVPAERHTGDTSGGSKDD